MSKIEDLMNQMVDQIKTEGILHANDMHSIRVDYDHDRAIAMHIFYKLATLASKRRRKLTVWKVLNEVVENYETYLQRNPLNYGINAWLPDYQPKPMPPKGFNLKEYVKTNFPQYSEKINTLLVFK